MKTTVSRLLIVSVLLLGGCIIVPTQTQSRESALGWLRVGTTDFMPIGEGIRIFGDRVQTEAIATFSYFKTRGKWPTDDSQLPPQVSITREVSGALMIIRDTSPSDNSRAAVLLTAKGDVYMPSENVFKNFDKFTRLEIEGFVTVHQSIFAIANAASSAGPGGGGGGGGPPPAKARVVRVFYATDRNVIGNS